MPALAKAMSRRPNRSMAVATSRSTSGSDDTSPATVATASPSSSADGFERGLVEVADDDPCTLGHEATGGGETDAGCAAGDDERPSRRSGANRSQHCGRS